MIRGWRNQPRPFRAYELTVSGQIVVVSNFRVLLTSFKESVEMEPVGVGFAGKLLQDLSGILVTLGLCPWLCVNYFERIPIKEIGPLRFEVSSKLWY